MRVRDEQTKACGISSVNSGYDAAQDPLGPQSNLQETDRENSYRNKFYKTVKAPKFICKCFTTSDVPKQPTAASPLQAADVNSATKSDVATSQLTGPVALKKHLLLRYTAETANNCDVATQTEEDERPLIKEMELTITQRDETIKQLREQIEAHREMRMDVSDSADPDVDESSEADHTSKVPDRNHSIRADGMVPIGSGNTLIPTKIYQNINWNTYTKATRKLLMTVFTRSVLATHSLTGKPSPAFPDRTPKKKLKETLVNDIVKTVARRCCVTENLVRNCITITCADECKRLRKRENKVHKENVPPESDTD